MKDYLKVFCPSVFILVFMAILFIPLEAIGAENVKMSVEAGFDRYIRPGQAAPLTVFIENNGSDINGDIKITSNLENNCKALYTRKAIIPAGSSKEIKMYIPAVQDVLGTKVRLYSGEEMLQESGIAVVNIWPIPLTVGVLASDPAALNYLEALKFNDSKQQIKVIHLETDDIPDNSLLLESLDIIAVNDYASEQLSDKQTAAIERWMEKGGLLILGGGSGWQKSQAAFQNLLPVKVDSSITVNGLPAMEEMWGEKISDGENFVISNSSLQKGEAILSQDNNPLIVQNRQGKGTVCFMAYDLSSAPIKNWAGNELLWKQLLSRIDPHQIISAGESKSEMMHQRDSMGWVLRNIPASDLPSSKSLALILLIYVLILGPGSYLFLKKLDRRELGWIIVPLLAVILFSSTYLLAFKGKGRDVYTNVMSFINIESGQKTNYIDSYVGVFAPSKRDYVIELDKDSLVRVLPMDRNNMRVYYNSQSRSENIMAQVEQERKNTVFFDDASRWSMRCINYQKEIDSIGEIQSRLYTDNGEIKGTISNQSSLNLSDCYVLNRYGWQKLGNVAVGQEVEVNLKPQLDRRGGSAIYRILDKYPVNWPMGYRPQAYTYSRQHLREQMEAALNINNFSDNPVFFIGRSSQEVDSAIMETSGMNYHSTILSAPLQVKMQNDSKLSIPAGFLNAYCIKTDGQNFHQDEWGCNIDGDTTVTFAVDIPFSIKNLQIDEATLYILASERSYMSFAVLDLLNWESGEWEAVKYQPYGIKLENTYKYLSPQGSMQIRSGTFKQQYVQIEGLCLGLEGHYSSAASELQQDGFNHLIKGGGE